MCKIGKSAADMMRAVQTVVYGDNAVIKMAVCDNGTAASEVGKNCLRMSLAVGGLQRL
jgi:hypothetical protein